MQLVGVRVLPIEVLAHGFGGELRLADVTEVPRQVYRLTWGVGGREVQEVKCKKTEGQG